MFRLLWLVLLISAALSILMLVTRVVFAARAGEIAFSSNRDGNWEIYLLDLQTGIARNLTRSLADDFTPAWSPDGRQLAFVSDRDGDKQQDLYVMDADGSHARQIGSGSSGSFADPMWTTDGYSLVSMHGWEQLYRVDTRNKSEQWLGIGFAPRLSPDGKSLLYYANGLNTSVYSNIYSLNLANHRVTNLTAGPFHSSNGQWSPDGREIVYMSLISSRTGIYIMNFDGSNRHAVTGNHSDTSPAWSPDGKQIVYASGGSGSQQLYIINADGTNQHAITHGVGSNGAPAWRP